MCSDIITNMKVITNKCINYDKKHNSYLRRNKIKYWWQSSRFPNSLHCMKFNSNVKNKIKEAKPKALYN